MNTWGGRRPGSGRPKGRRNRRTDAVEELLERLNCDPVEGMARIANNDKEALGIREDVPIALRARMYEALAPYLRPKLKSTEITHVDVRESESNVSLTATDAFITRILADELTEAPKNRSHVKALAHKARTAKSLQNLRAPVTRKTIP